MKSLIYLIILIFVFTSCVEQKGKTLIKFSGETQGTYYVVTYYDDLDRNFQEEIELLLKDFDLVASMWVENSIISKVNRNEPEVEVGEIFTTLFEMSKDVNTKSGGAFDPTIGPLVNAWGFGFTDRMKVDQHIVDSLLPFVDNHFAFVNNYRTLS